MRLTTSDQLLAGDLTQPTEFVRRTVSRALRARKRYRYVTPRVRIVVDGILIKSPCCSRNIDPAGGTVDIALIEHLQTGSWRLFRKNHATHEWELFGVYDSLQTLLEPLVQDADRSFWQ